MNDRSLVWLHYKFEKKSCSPQTLNFITTERDNWHFIVKHLFIYFRKWGFIFFKFYFFKILIVEELYVCKLQSLCCVFVNSNPMVGTINKIFTSWELDSESISTNINLKKKNFFFFFLFWLDILWLFIYFFGQTQVIGIVLYASHTMFFSIEIIFMILTPFLNSCTQFSQKMSHSLLKDLTWLQILNPKPPSPQS